MAHDIYLRGAIGNSAWPIGLTMVGIHERSGRLHIIFTSFFPLLLLTLVLTSLPFLSPPGREKISTSKVAHVMNNELQRKYFTSVKRLMSYAQSKRPDIAPSMKSL